MPGGRDSLAGAAPQKTVGSGWPYATTLFDPIRRATLYDAPQSGSANETCAVSAYALHLDGLLPEDAALGAGAPVRVPMANRDGFTHDPRSDVPSAGH